jgi:hypothetical protein
LKTRTSKAKRAASRTTSNNAGVTSRAYGKQIRETSTRLGFTVWSGNDQRLTYGDLDLAMTQFRAFLQQQLHETQAQPQELLLVNWDDIPTLDIQALKDPRNIEQLAGGENWLLGQMLKSSEL